MGMSMLLLSSQALASSHFFSLFNATSRENTGRLETSLDSGAYSQKLNHFDPLDSRTLSERFAIYTDFAGSHLESAPVVYYFCGEWACTESDRLSQVPGAIANYARALSAVVVVIEHRYYGQSKPFQDISPEHMKYLSYEQALEDFSDFENYAKERYQLRGKWIAVGGSYPGALSAYFRAFHPEQVVGALSSSGVVKAITAFESYDKKVADALGPICLLAVQNATHQIEASLHDQNRFQSMKTLFNANDITDPPELLELIANAADSAVQYGLESSFCSDVLSEDPLQGLSKASQNINHLLAHPGSPSDDES
jgi:pimeloyl-ACP methyl ester carboxylesterase